MSRTIETIGQEIKTSDFEKLLSLAEVLKDKCEVASRRIELTRTLQVGYGVGAILSIALVVLTYQESYRSIFAILGILALLGSIAMAMREQLQMRRIKRRSFYDRRALTEILGLLREVESTEDWSVLEKAYYKIRLSRFAISYLDKKERLLEGTYLNNLSSKSS